MRQAALIVATILATSSPTTAQIENRSGWSQSDGYGGTWGQTRDGTSWREQNNGYGTKYYSDTSGRHCWTEDNGYGGSFTSCN